MDVELTRQKQYFEQRKRQQQQTAGLESYSDGNRLCNLQCEYSRSLDILSLENVSTVAQEHKTSCITGNLSQRLKSRKPEISGYSYSEIT